MIFFQNRFSRHLKWNETKFNGTLNETRFGLRARVSRMKTCAELFRDFFFFKGPAAVIALKLLEENNEYLCAFLESPVNDLSHYRKFQLIHYSLIIQFFI
jgi:hypothetical protein